MQGNKKKVQNTSLRMHWTKLMEYLAFHQRHNTFPNLSALNGQGNPCHFLSLEFLDLISNYVRSQGG